MASAQTPREPPKRPFLKRFGWLAGAVAGIVLAGFAVITWHAYTLGMRTGSESVAPLIRAERTPEKVKPANPGAEEPHQGTSVYGTIESGSKKEAPKNVEHLLPPPEEPVARPKPKEAPKADAPQPALSPAPQPAPTQVPQAATAPPTPPPQGAKAPQPAAAPAPSAPGPTVPSPAPTVQAPTPAAQPPAAQTPASPTPAAPTAEQKPPTPSAGAPTPLVPSTPPSAPTATPPVQPTGTPPVQKVPDVAATAVKPMTGGTHKIQLVATKTEDEAKAELQRLRAKHGGVIGKLNTTIVRADLGEKGVFYRVQAGPLDAEGAKAACAQLRQQNAGCIVVRP